MNWDIIVIGGGASGLMAATIAGKQGKQVLILEQMDKCGKKILVLAGKAQPKIIREDELNALLATQVL